MKKTTLLLPAILLLASLVMAIGDTTVNCGWAATNNANDAILGEDMENNASITFAVDFDNSGITVSNLILTISPLPSGVGSINITGFNGTNNSYYEYTISEVPDETYSYYATATYVNTTNSDGINLTSLSSTCATREVTVETSEGSLRPQEIEKEAKAEKEKKSNWDLIALLIIAVAVIYFMSKDKHN